MVDRQEGARYEFASMQGTKTVWVLGSGFSKSLGGPLLYGLFGDKAKQEIREVFPQIGGREIAYHLFRKHKGVLWDHAEDFLSFIDTALLPDSPQRGILERHLNVAAFEVFGGDPQPVPIDKLRRQAILTVAAECRTYTEQCDVRAEAWGPYVAWARALGDSDTIVTFNYDLALEKLGEADGVRAVGVATVAFPHDHEGNLDTLEGAGLCEIFKLHGSADWAFNDRGDYKRLQSLGELAEPGGYRLLIATPGATKARYVAKSLRVLWGRATDALSKAEVIVFVGYRFPPSDSESRTRLLRAIEENQSPLLTIHTVLGPDINASDVARLKGLLTHKLRAAGRVDAAELGRTSGAGRYPSMYSVVPQPLFAEDFLSVFNPAQLHDSQLAGLIRQSRA